MTNPEKEPQISKEKSPTKPNSPNLSSSENLSNQISNNKLSPEKSSAIFNVLQPVVRIVPVNFKETYQETNSSRNDNQTPEQFTDLGKYYSKKKKRKTEQEKLIASLMQTELPHVDGAFKRSTTIRYRNLNEDRLLDNLFDSRVGKPRRSSGKRMLCLSDMSPQMEEEDVSKLDKKVKQSETDEKPSEIPCEIKETVPENEAEGNNPLTNAKTHVEHRKKRMTEKEKLIENLSAVERIHVDGAFKRNALNNGKLKNKNEVGGDHRQTEVFSPVKFVGLDGDIESLILEKTGTDAT